MPQTDRIWWLQALFALVLAATAVVGSVLLAYTALPLATYGESITGDLLLALGTFLFFLAISIGIAISSIRAHHRMHLRKRALVGNVTMMPLAAIPSYPDRAPDVSPPPLVLEWRATNARG